jgi:hypothetical protein
MSFSRGDLFHIEMRSGVYQVLDLYGSDEKGNIYYFRKVFDGKLKFKMSKAEFVHESWMTHISEKTRAQLTEALDLPEVKAALEDLTIERLMQFGTNAGMRFVLCTIDAKSKKKLEKRLNDGVSGFIDIKSLENELEALNASGEIHLEENLAYPPDGKKLYRIELGRYCDDFDENGNNVFREIRFGEIKMYKREDLVE